MRDSYEAIFVGCCPPARAFNVCLPYTPEPQTIARSLLLLPTG